MTWRSIEKLDYRRKRNPIAVGLWLGPAEGPDVARHAWFYCPLCQAEWVVEVGFAVVTAMDWKQVIRREPGCEVVGIAIRNVPCRWKADAFCAACRRELELHIIGRWFEPWTFGTGRVRVTPNWPEAPHGDSEGAKP